VGTLLHGRAFVYVWDAFIPYTVDKQELKQVTFGEIDVVF